ncbi:MAG: hypothetical protein Kow00124_26740 [Anaerolineae bacterium]
MASGTQPEIVSLKHERIIVALIMAASVLLMVGFSLGPIFEGPDELHHYRYIRILLTTRALPDPAGAIGGENFQPPLYYLLNVPILAAVGDDAAGFAYFEQTANPYRGYAFTTVGHDNKHVYVHTAAERSPFTKSGIALAVHVLRLGGLLLGALTLLAAYGVFCELWPLRPAVRLLALGFTAFWPQFLYQSSVITNDNLLVLMCGIALLLMLRWLRLGPSWRRAAILGLVLGAALLTEASAAHLAIPMGLVILLDLKRSWRHALLVLGVVFVVAGWWYIRNWVVYGHPLLLNAVAATWASDIINGGRFSLPVALDRLPTVYHTAWARFGMNFVPVADALYRGFDVLALLALGGLLIYAARLALRRAHLTSLSGRQTTIIGAVLVAVLLLVIYWSGTVWSGNQGRFMLTAAAAWSAALAAGIAAWLPRRVELRAALAAVSLFAAVATVSLFGFFLPAYRVWSVPPEIANPLMYRYGDVAELIGTDRAQLTASPGETVFITLYWRALRPTDAPLLSFLHSLESDVVHRDTLTGLSNLLSTDWQPGQTWAERYVIMIPDDAEPQRVYPLVAGLYDPSSESTLPAAGADGQAVTPLIGRVAINGPTADVEPVYRFGDVIGLAEPTLSERGGTLEVCLPWVALAQSPADYQVFVHVLSLSGDLLAQHDGPPRGGQYPTGAWRPGEVVEDCVTIDIGGLSVTGWRVGVGLYDLASGGRLPARAADGLQLPDDIVFLSR